MKESFPGNKESGIEGVARELIRMSDADQAMRNSATWDSEVDARNIARMKEVVANMGWPAISKVGDRAASAAWLLVQHADRDPAFQQECLALMRSLPPGEVQKRHIAYLEDRVRVNTGRPTLYGTQFYNNKQGAFGPRPIEDQDTLDERRAAAGLGPFAEYEKKLRQIDEERQEQLRATRKDK